MKKLLLMAAALGIFSGVYAKKVRVQVDMAGQTVGANGVHVAGNFQGWSPSGTPLANSGGTIYSAVVDVPAHTVMEYKFINGNDWPQEEQIPEISRMGYAGTNKQNNGNRWFYVDSLADDTTIMPEVLFSGSAPAGKVALRLAVDMKLQGAVSADGIHVAGAFQGWVPDATRLANLFPSTKVYEWIAYVTAGTFQYKFINGNGWGAVESVPSSCAFGNDQNREITVSGDQSAIVCYASCDPCPSAKYIASFIVDMSNSDCNGGFDSVTVTGNRVEISSWGDGVTLSKMGNTMFYVIELLMDSGEIEFKFRSHKNGVTSWEGGDNRKWVLSANDTLDLTCFGSRVVGACPSKPAPSDITFMVDMTNETPDGQGMIYVIGEFTVPNWQSGAIRLSPVAGHPGFYATTVNVCQGTFSYKFMNGDSSVMGTEENFPDSTKRACLIPSGVGNYNRSYTRTSANPVLLAFVYNECTTADTTTSTGLSKTAGMLNQVKVYPNPSASVVNIEFNDHALRHQVTIMDIAGRTVAAYNDVTDNKLVLNKAETGTGMLFVNITNNRGESKTVKLIVQ